MNLKDLSFDVLMYSGHIGFFLLTLVLVCGFMLGNILSGRQFRYAFLVSHIILIGTVGLLLQCSSGDALSGMLWVIPLTLDFTLWPFKAIFGSFADWGFSLLPLGLLIVGGTQWYFTGHLIDYLWPKLMSKVRSRVQ